MRGISASQNTGLEEEGMTGKKVRKPTGDQMQGGGGGLVVHLPSCLLMIVSSTLLSPGGEHLLLTSSSTLLDRHTSGMGRRM